VDEAQAEEARATTILATESEVNPRRVTTGRSFPEVYPAVSFATIVLKWHIPKPHGVVPPGVVPRGPYFSRTGTFENRVLLNRTLLCGEHLKQVERANVSHRGGWQC